MRDLTKFEKVARGSAKPINQENAGEIYALMQQLFWRGYAEEFCSMNGEPYKGQEIFIVEYSDPPEKVGRAWNSNYFFINTADPKRLEVSMRISGAIPIDLGDSSGNRSPTSFCVLQENGRPIGVYFLEEKEKGPLGDRVKGTIERFFLVPESD